MASRITRAARTVGKSWERWLFGLVGFACLGFTFRLLVTGQIPSASVVFAMAFFSFFYSNLARFRRFKGLGFEAELWEDKQKEAASLIDRLQSVVSLYTREIVLGTVMRGRLGDADSWTKRWALYDELVGQHRQLGQSIDFAPLKAEIDSVFLFDLSVSLASSIRKAIDKAKTDVSEALRRKYGQPVTDNAGWNADQQRLQAVDSRFDDLFDRTRSENIAKDILAKAEAARDTLGSGFQVTPDYDEAVMARLRELSATFEQRPILITPTLVQWADDGLGRD